MIKLQFIKSLYDACLTYYQARGIAWFDPNVFNIIVDQLAHGTYSREQLAKQVISEIKQRNIKPRFPIDQEQIRYFLRMMWYLGLARSENEKWTLTKLGFDYAKTKKVTILLRAAERWYPALYLLQCVLNGVNKIPEIVKTLGKEMQYWTQKMAQLGFTDLARFKSKGVQKPYNEFVVKQLLIPFLEYIGLIEVSRNKISIIGNAKALTTSLNKSLILTCFAPNDPILFGALYDLSMKSKELTIISSAIDEKTLKGIASTFPGINLQITVGKHIGLLPLKHANIYEIHNWTLPTIIIGNHSCIMSSSPLVWGTIEKSFGFVIYWKQITRDLYDELKVLINRIIQ